MFLTLKPFEYLQPKSVEEACQILSEYGPRCKILAGGCDLVPSMRRRMIQPEYVASIGSIPGLDFINADGEYLRIGCLVKMRPAELSPDIKKDYPVLYEALSNIASTPLKNTCTIVGNICVASPASDIIPTLIAYDASLKVLSINSERILPMEDFCIGAKQCSLNPGEIVTEVMIPKPSPGTTGTFVKIVRTAEDIAKVNVAVVVIANKNLCWDVRIVIGSAAPTPIRVKKAERILKGQYFEQALIEKAAEAAAEEIRPITDIRSTGQYRKEVSRVLVQRALSRAIGKPEK